MWSNRHLRAFRETTRQLRTKRGLSQEDLAYSVATDISYLTELENGKKEPCLRKMKEIAQGLGGTLSRMMQGFEEFGQTLRSISRIGGVGKCSSVVAS